MIEPKPARRRASRQAPDVRRHDLLAATINCLARLGPRGATGREICRQAGVSHGLLRHYFTDPENLLLETYLELCNTFIARFAEELRAPDPDPWKALDSFFAVLFSDEWASFDILGAWLAFWTLVRNNQDFAKVSEDFNRRLRELLQAGVARLPTAGRIPHADVAAILSAVMDGLWLEYCLSPDRLPRERAIELCSLTLRRLVPQVDSF
jgi:TetR/AcrR family transcriptional repressor of bet genes